MMMSASLPGRQRAYLVIQTVGPRAFDGGELQDVTGFLQQKDENLR